MPSVIYTPPTDLSLYPQVSQEEDRTSRWRTTANLVERDVKEHHAVYKEYLSNHCIHDLLSLYKLGGNF